MKVVMTFDFNDEERERVTGYYRKYQGQKGLPKLATRETLREWINDAISCHWINVEDVEAHTQD